MMLMMTKKGKTVSNQEPPRLAAPPQQPPRLSSKAAAVAEEMENLEVELWESQQRAMNMENRAKVAEDNCHNLEKLLDKASNDRDYYQRRWTETLTKLQMSASIILDAMKEGRSDNDPYQPKSPAEQAIAGAINEVDNVLRGEPEQVDLPGFLKSEIKPTQ